MTEETPPTPTPPPTTNDNATMDGGNTDQMETARDGTYPVAIASMASRGGCFVQTSSMPIVRAECHKITYCVDPHDAVRRNVVDVLFYCSITFSYVEFLDI